MTHRIAQTETSQGHLCPSPDLLEEGRHQSLTFDATLRDTIRGCRERPDQEVHQEWVVYHSERLELIGRFPKQQDVLVLNQYLPL